MSAATLRLLGERGVAAPARGSAMFMDRPLVLPNKTIWPWRMTPDQRQAVRPLREFFDGSHLERVIDARVAETNAKRRKRR